MSFDKSGEIAHLTARIAAIRAVADKFAALVDECPRCTTINHDVGDPHGGEWKSRELLKDELAEAEADLTTVAIHLERMRVALYRMQLSPTQAMKLPLVERRLLMERSAKELAEEGGE